MPLCFKVAKPRPITYTRLPHWTLYFLWLMSLVPRSESYALVWSVSGHQNATLTCLAISPAGTYMIVALEDRNMLLIDFSNGSVIGIISFEDQFYALAAEWYSESNLIIGCSNGALYYVYVNPTSVSAFE